MFRPEQGAVRRGADTSGMWMDTADRSEAPRVARAQTDGRHRNGDDEEADGEDEGVPSCTAAPGAGRSRAPERCRRDGATPRRGR